MYKSILKLLFILDAERVHKLSLRCVSVLIKIPFVRGLLKKNYQFYSPLLSTKCLGLEFKNPLGLGAGFDKNAKYLDVLECFGFGFVEIGTVTPKPQQGNPKPRLFRLISQKALINRMGFNNIGVDRVIKNLKKYKKTDMLIGGNIGKNKDTSIDNTWKDYLFCFQKLYKYVDFFVVNVSSPNTKNLRNLQKSNHLKKILLPLLQHRSKQSISKAILVKISPDISADEAKQILAQTSSINIDGLVCANTTIKRVQDDEMNKQDKILLKEQGGLSGLPLNRLSEKILKELSVINKKMNYKMTLISSGGIFSANDVIRRKKNDVSLYEIWTSFIYEGPSIVKKILKPLSI